MTKDFLESLIKGRIAETIVKEMFRKAGFVVFPFGVENSLTALTEPPYNLPSKKKTFRSGMFDQMDKDLFLSDVVARTRNLPDFLVVRKAVDTQSYKLHGCLHGANDYAFIEVKYRGNAYFTCSDEYAHFMTGVNLVMVSSKAPYFHTTVIYPKEVREKYKDGWLEDHGTLDHAEMISLNKSHCFPEFEDFDFKPYIEMIKKYLKYENKDKVK